MAPGAEWILRRHSSELKKNKILLRILHLNGKPYHPTEHLHSYSVFHVLDLNTGEISTLDPILIDDDLYGYMVVVDSTIYVIGKLDPSDPPSHRDSIHYHQGLSYLDMCKSHQIGWRGAPVMSSETLFGDCVSYGGKIYAFRGSIGSCVCEVFDPESNQWGRIKSSPLPLGCEITRPVMVDPSNKRILVCVSDISVLLAYYPDEDRWDSLDDGFRGWRETQRLQVVFAKGIIYVHDSGWSGKLRAYDVNSKQWLNVTLASSDFESFLHPRYNFLHYLGNGLLCFVGFPDVLGTNKSHTSIYVVQFKVELQNDPKEVIVTSVSSKTYDHLDCIFNVRQCLPI